ncbi:MAG TPA: serine hydrolase domain-containing protein, partial [Candidatus Dormibacteraeota bacterium]|nr:serine hydrolase domain-containing protein [Candidatus Dormibacteraeota bacterium]
EGVIPGAALLIARRGEVAFEGYVGLADRKRAVRAGADTLWSIASITKPVTVAAMMACVDRGLLAVDEPLHDVLPEFARPGDRRPWRRDVTLRHLVTHTSGLAGFSRDNLELRKRHAPIDDFITSFLDEEVHFEPGRWHLYSSVGLGLVAECIGRRLSRGDRSMEAYERFTLQLLKDLGATDFVFRPDGAQQERIAWVESTGQEGLDWEIGNSRYFRSLGFPWGGLYMRARDVLAFIQAFLPAGKTDALSRASRTAMATQQVAPPEAPVDIAPQQRDVTWDASAPPRASVPWGLGWQVKGDQPNDFMGTLAHATAFGHYGASGSIAWADPEEELAVVLLTNRAWQSWWPIQEGRAARLADAIMSWRG